MLMLAPFLELLRSVLTMALTVWFPGLFIFEEFNSPRSFFSSIGCISEQGPYFTQVAVCSKLCGCGLLTRPRAPAASLHQTCPLLCRGRQDAEFLCSDSDVPAVQQMLHGGNGFRVQQTAPALSWKELMLLGILQTLLELLC